METKNNQEIIQQPNSYQSEPRNNNIQRPQKIQKIVISHMEPELYQDYGASSSGGQPNYNGNHKQRNDEIPRTHQEDNFP